MEIDTRKVEWGMETSHGYEEVDNPQISVSLIGHSFVQRLHKALVRYRATDDDAVAEALNLKENNIRPFIHGTSGARIEHIDSFKDKAVEQFPHAIMLDIGQNDLCWTSNGSPKELAENMLLEINNLFRVYDRLEVVMYCKVTHKTKMKRSDKKLEKFNRDVDLFNYELLKKTRNQLRIIRWNHRGMFAPKKPYTNDGTHPDSCSGFWSYVKSVSAAFRCIKEKMMDRRKNGKRTIRRRELNLKKERRANKYAKRDEKRSQALLE